MTPLGTYEINAKWVKGNLTLKAGNYGNGGTALVLFNGDEREAVASTNLEQYGVATPPTNQVWLKGWSENEGLPEALEKAGAVRLTGDVTPAGFATAQLAIVVPLERGEPS